MDASDQVINVPAQQSADHGRIKHNAINPGDTVNTNDTIGSKT